MKNEGGAVESFLSGKFTTVDIGGIERQLKGLWQKAAESDSPVMRAVSFNLILFTTEDEAESEGGDLLDQILLAHPGRAILAIMRPERAAHLEAWVSARCHMVGKSKQVCSEQITVVSEGQGPNEMPSVVMPLLIPDLPVFLWWRHSRLDQTTIKPYLTCSSHLIVDSQRNPLDLLFLARLVELTRPGEDCVIVSDLNWRRVVPWCKAVADAFDGYPMETAALDAIASVRILYNLPQDHKTPASAAGMMLGCWLADRLGWKPKSFARDDIGKAVFSTRSGSSVTVSFEGTAAAQVEPGSIIGCLFDFVDGRSLQVHYEVQADAVELVSTTEVDSGKLLEEPNALNVRLDEVALVGREIEAMGPPNVYRRTIDMMRRLFAV